MTRSEAKKVAIAWIVKRLADDGVFENVIFRHEHGLSKDPEVLHCGPLGVTVQVAGHEIDICTRPDATPNVVPRKAKYRAYQCQDDPAYWAVSNGVGGEALFHSSQYPNNQQAAEAYADARNSKEED